MHDEDLKLAYYTDFDTALKIIDGRSIWLRNTQFMNDVGEIEHGRTAMDAVLSDHSVRARMKEVLDPINQAITLQLISIWETLRSKLVRQIYIACFSEHPHDEDDTGRLSMWRSYCAKPDGVAFILTTSPFMLETNEFNAYSSPVYYGHASDLKGRFFDILMNIENNYHLFRNVNPETVLILLYLAILYGAVCLKHPGFREEAEWRILFMPNAINQNTRLLRIDGVLTPAQTVWALPLVDDPRVGLVGLELDSLVQRVIIGPSSRTQTIAEALTAALTRQGVTNAADRIVVSGIPLRPNPAP